MRMFSVAPVRDSAVRVRRAARLEISDFVASMLENDEYFDVYLENMIAHGEREATRLAEIEGKRSSDPESCAGVAAK